MIKISKKIVNLYENGKGISELSREYGVGKSTIDGWIKKFKTITTSTGEVTKNDEILKLQKKNRKLEQEVEIKKKKNRYILKKLVDKIKFIDENKYLYDVRTLCKCLNIHHSVYYYHCNHKENSYQIVNKKLDVEIERIYKASKKDIIRLR